VRGQRDGLRRYLNSCERPSSSAFHTVKVP
jgi:hypothetical protein